MVICVNSPFYHRRALPITRIVCKRHKLSGNRKITRREREFGLERIAEELYLFQGYTKILIRRNGKAIYETVTVTAGYSGTRKC